jgi:hypothetical protein
MDRSTLTVAAKKVNGKWHGAVITNDAFALSFIETDLETLMTKALIGVFIDRPEGASVNVNVLTLPPVTKESLSNQTASEAK